MLDRSNPSGSEGGINLLVLQPTPFCNLDCRYCYLPDRSVNRKMEFGVLREVVSKIVSSPYLASTLRVCWHAGEPTVLPVEYYEKAFSIIESARPHGVKVEHLFQTNGTLLNEEWCEFFKRHSVAVGVSIDGPEIINDTCRIDRQGNGTFKRTMQGIRLLQRHDVLFHVIAVLSRASLSKADVLFEFFVEHQIHQVCFNIEEQEGANPKSSLQYSEVETEFRNFFSIYYSRLESSGFPHWVREIDFAMNAVFWSDLAAPSNALTEPFASVNVDYLGNFATFCPELLSMKTENYGQLVFGNLLADRLEDCSSNKIFQRANEDIQEGVRLCKETCSYFGVCGGGAPSNKLYENGTFASSETLFCRLIIKAMTDLALGWVEEKFSSVTPPTIMANRGATKDAREIS
ncbi:GRRM system radical SAM/SPASM domain protein [Bradyrhizobium sp. 138]|uniref:cyclophane-forming radical SAM/SPASM peptide maturase GrrM/OscB n=1 Tax=Bradyrhizobium sp. 138 TaxID=2782615 RepID=UPI001FF78DB7|nr:GRRM system radical SAM/SPASM domain protein [Bradyrhizobium sp. 138]